MHHTNAKIIPFNWSSVYAIFIISSAHEDFIIDYYFKYGMML